MKDLTKKLNQFREIEPDEKYWHVNRSILLNTIQANTKQQGFEMKSLFFNINILVRSIFPTMKVITTSFVILITVLVTGLGAQASGPDDFLFPGKLMMERGQLLLTKNSEKTELRFKYIEKRLKEIDELIQKDKPNHIAKATKNIESNLKQVQQDLELIQQNKDVDDKEIVQIASLIDFKTNEISESLKQKEEVARAEIDQTIKVNNSLSQTALDTIINTDTELAELELELIKNSINNKIELQKDRFAEMGERITQVQDLEELEAQEKLIFEAEFTESDSETTSTADLVEVEFEEQPIEVNISEISNIDSDQILEKLEQARESLNQDDYAGAVLKLKEAEFYIDLTSEVTEKALENIYESKIEEIEQEIEEVKGVTEQVLE